MEGDISSPNLSLSSLSYGRVLPFDVGSNPECYPLHSPAWLLQLIAPFTGLHNELLIIAGPHQVSFGAAAAGLLLSQVGMVTAGAETWRRPPKGPHPLLISPLLRRRDKHTFIYFERDQRLRVEFKKEVHCQAFLSWLYDCLIV